MTSEPLPLDASSDEAFERALLGSASVDAPPSGAAKLALARFAATASNVTSLGAPPALVPRSRVRSVMSWFGAGMLTLGAGTAGYVAGTQQSVPTPSPLVQQRASPPPAVAPTAAPLIDEPHSREVPSARALSSESRAAAERSVPPRRDALRIERSLPKVPSTAAASLREEVARLDAARTALAIGNFDAVAGLLETYRIDFPHGVLAREADLVAISALTEKGDREGARRRAHRFLSTYPRDVHAARVKQLVSAEAAASEAD